MAQVLFTADTTPSLADLDANFESLYGLRELISTPSHGTAADGSAFPAYTGSNVKFTVDASFNWLIGTSSATPATSNVTGIALKPGGALSQMTGDGSPVLALNRKTNTGELVRFYQDGVQVGNVSVTGSATAYNTSSDYRLKDITGPLTTSGAFIDALNPVVGTWKADGAPFVGFVAHEVQDVSPSTVIGEKDAVAEDGSPVYQAMEYGSAEFIANIVAELQSLRARVATLEAA